MGLLRRHIQMPLIFFTLFAGVGFANQGKPQLPPSKNGIVIFSGPVEFGELPLPAGIYEFHCIHKGKYHLMAVYRVVFGPPPAKGAMQRPVAIDFCRMEPLREKVKVTSVVTTRDNSRSEAIKEIRIQGEQVRHIFGDALAGDAAERL